ncbi:MAG: peptidoglycan DD-metalloendopeptidase family protein [Oscillospiraceae bacterium]|nr:peptidoglycan DD-metalloendopeptidase family protein [Oscillospiraceae bacterium]
MYKNRISGFNRRMRATALAVLAAAGGMSLFGGSVCCAVKADGESSDSRAFLRETADSTGSSFAGALWQKLYIEPEITAAFAPDLTAEAQPEEEPAKAPEEEAWLWGISVDGALVGACADRERAESIIQEKMDRFVDENTTSVFMIQDVEIAPIDIVGPVLQDEAEISRLLDPDSEDSEFALKILVTQRETEARLIPYETEINYTDEMYEDTEERTVKGFEGAGIAVVEVEYLNGNEVLKTDLSLEVVSEPVTEVITKGTAPRPRTASYGEYIWPVTGHITSEFEPRHISISSSFHKGIDIATDHGTPIVAADGGEVICAEYSGSYGKLVQILHDNGDITYYAHCSSIAVSVGQRVARGEVISYVGSTGNSTGDHCHFEIRVNDEPQNPLNYLP